MSKLRAQSFIGYTTLEAWAASVNKEAPAYAVLVRHPGPEAHGSRTDDLMIVCGQPDDVGDVHYCRMRVASVAMMYGEPFSPDHKERVQDAEAAWALVSAWLKEQGLTTREALISLPSASSKMTLTQGWPEWLKRDPTTKAFYRAA